MTFNLTDETVEALLEFRKARDWEQFHTPRNLALSIVLESAELLETFQWVRSEKEASERTTQRKAVIAEEIADLTIYLTYLVNDLGIDLDKVVQAKLKLNDARYPVNEFRGSARKHNDR